MPSNAPIKKVFGATSKFIIAIGFYFMGWIFFDPFYSGAMEIAMAIIFSIFCTVLFVTFMMVLTKEITNVRELKNSFLGFMDEIRNVDYRKLLKTAMKKDLYDEVYQEELKNTTKTFQKRVYEKAKELVD